MASSSLNKIDILRFLELAESFPVIDVRSPSEFDRGHIPGAFNIPLFSDREREAVGIDYIKKGKSRAIIKGLELTGPSMHLKLKEALKIASKGKLLVHCWRGGMRSEAMAWLFSLGDLETEILEGGYKSYRNHVLAGLSEKRRIIILGGMTGSSKTQILRHIKNIGKQVIDLEGIANHKGSAFGALGQEPQPPSSEHFENLLFDEWKKINFQEPLWLEDESKNIGSVFLPDAFYFNMQESPAIILLMNIEKRLPRLIGEYSTYSPDLLKGIIMKISKRLGGDNTKEALNAIDTGDFAKAIEITLRYYDKTYKFAISKKRSGKTIYVETETDNIEKNAISILEAAKQITW
ncbi:MAG: tRNA 2-selenouridine(34) synthase MnmH [Bacteroidota bacterium]|nr:tRNA 2-selenouridine(34) synthase MnmH [Bacteroidota bacterium]